ncbi:MAG: P-loop NTPase, partial [Longimicrobiales bacterium]
TPSRAAAGVVARALTYVREARVPHIGIVANMDYHTCATCGAATPLFAAADAGATAGHNDDEVWARLPFDPAAADATDRGAALPADAPLTAAFHALASRVAREIAPAASVLP